jgi:hypothetical protein
VVVAAVAGGTLLVGLLAVTGAIGAGRFEVAGPVAPLPARPADRPAPAPDARTVTGAPATSSSTGPPSRPTSRPAPPATAPTPAAPTSAAPTPTPAAPTATGPPSSCQGAVRYDLDLADTELALIESLCFATGAVLRLQGIGPGLVTAEPAELVSSSYAAGVVDLRFVRPGTVLVGIPRDEQTYQITVVVR